MATNKKAISAYLPTDLEEYLTQYCTEYNITRKDKTGEIKPALGTAIVEILRVFFSGDNVPSPLPDNVPLLPSNVVTEDRLQEILSKNQASNVPIDVPSNVATQDDISKVLDTVPSIVQEKLSNVESNLLGAVNEKLEQAIANLKTDEEFLRAIVLEVQKIASEDALKQTKTVEDEETTTQIDKASLDPIFDEMEEPEIEKLLSKKEAFAIAQRRGNKSVSTTAFARWFRENEGETLYGIKKHSEHEKYVDVGEVTSFV